jgi:hypothetical protein
MKTLVALWTGDSKICRGAVNTFALQMRVAASTQFLLNKRPKVERIIFFMNVFV